MKDDGRYSPDAASAGRRFLKNACLDLLAVDGNAEGIERSARQYQAAGNMTDRIAALATLSLHDVPQRAHAIEDFYRRYAGDPLILDKWFSLQAGIPEAGTLDRVREPHDASRLFVFQSQPRAVARRCIRAGQPDAVQPPRWGRLRIHCRQRARAGRRRIRRSPHACFLRSRAGAPWNPNGARVRKRHCGGSRRLPTCRATSATSCSGRSPTAMKLRQALDRTRYFDLSAILRYR